MGFNNTQHYDMSDTPQDLSTSSSGAVTIGLSIACVGLPIALLAWCFWLGHRHQSRRRRVVAQGSTQAAHEFVKEISVVKKKENVVAYFEETGNQMELTKENLIEGIKQESDIEAPPIDGGPLLVLVTDKVGGGSDGAKPEHRIVPDCCAICLDSYEEKDRIVWSENNDCPHVFHQDCFVDYLMAHRGTDSPCPMCRQDFCLGPVFPSPTMQEQESS